MMCVAVDGSSAGGEDLPLDGLCVMIVRLLLVAQEGRTSLLMACVKGRLDVVQALLDAGADKEAKDGVSGRLEQEAPRWSMHFGASYTFTYCNHRWRLGGRLWGSELEIRSLNLPTSPVCADWQHTPHGGWPQGPPRSGARPAGCGR